jgi:dTDP-glucose pyrophosphorylase
MALIETPDFNLVMPMAGNGNRFLEAGFLQPKPFIYIHGSPMFHRAIECLGFQDSDLNPILLVQKKHFEKWHDNIYYYYPSAEVVLIDRVTNGAACTVLLAEEYINNNKPLLIVNSDQIIKYNPISFFNSTIDADGVIMTFPCSEEKWSYAKTKNGFVTEVAEKRVISNEATVGIYWFSKGSEFVKYAKQMIKKDVKTNNEFYICPIYNEFIEAGAKIKTFNVDKMIGLGTPEDLQKHLFNETS